MYRCANVLHESRTHARALGYVITNNDTNSDYSDEHIDLNSIGRRATFRPLSVVETNGKPAGKKKNRSKSILHYVLRDDLPTNSVREYRARVVGKKQKKKNPKSINIPYRHRRTRARPRGTAETTTARRRSGSSRGKGVARARPQDGGGRAEIGCGVAGRRCLVAGGEGGGRGEAVEINGFVQWRRRG